MKSAKINSMQKSIKEYIKLLNKTQKQINYINRHKIDSEALYLKKVFDIAYENELFKLFDYDIKTQDKLKRKLFEKLTIYSGSLSFLAIQILAANAIMNKNNFHKKEYYFNKKCGIAINHLRSKETKVWAKKYENGYLLNGTLTWASGYKIFDKLLIGFHFENKEYEVLTSFKEEKGFNILETPLTFVGQALNTVNIELKNFFVKKENLVSENEIGNYTKNKSLSKTVHYAIYSLALATIKQIKNNEFKKEAKKRVKNIKKQFLKCENGIILDELRIKLFNLVQKLITTAMILNGGKSILSNENLQRYYRELIMFNSNGLNQNIKELFLDDLIIKSS